MVTINTDDPAMFGRDLAGEYRAVVTELGFGIDVAHSLALKAIEASWAGGDHRPALRAGLVALQSRAVE